MKNGSRTWTNDLEGKHIVVGRVALEDLIEFQKIEFNVIRGYYFDDSHIKKINTSVVKLFNERLKIEEGGQPRAAGH